MILTALPWYWKVLYAAIVCLTNYGILAAVAYTDQLIGCLVGFLNSCLLVVNFSLQLGLEVLPNQGETVKLLKEQRHDMSIRGWTEQVQEAFIELETIAMHFTRASTQGSKNRGQSISQNLD